MGKGKRATKGQEKKQPSAVLFVPRTKGGKLATLLKEKGKELAINNIQTVRIVKKKNGDRLEHILAKADPVGEERCDRPECLLCQTNPEGVGRCRTTNIVYKTTCRRCEEKGVNTEYWGESARSGYQRGSEHSTDLRDGRESSHMARHLAMAHSEVDLGDPEMRVAELGFKMKIHKKFKYPMDRQLCEAIKIARAGGLGAPNIMNAKEEYSRCLISQIEMSGGSKMNHNNKNPTTTTTSGKRGRDN